MAWSRDSGWQQGSVVSRADLQLLVPTLELDESTVGVVVSHDCDIASREQVEPDIEIILAQPVATADGNCTFAKNPRKLHLGFDLGDGQQYLELIAYRKLRIAKGALVNFQPAMEWSIDPHAREILQGWLAARYRRHALPDELVSRLDPFLDFLTRQLKSKVKEILGVWIAYDPMEALASHEPYELLIYIVYGIDEVDGFAAASELAAVLESRFSALLEKNRGAGMVELGDCIAISEDGFTLRDLRRTTELRMEYLSYRAGLEGGVT